MNDNIIGTFASFMTDIREKSEDILNKREKQKKYLEIIYKY